MIMAIIGWVVCIVAMASFTSTTFLVALNNLGDYNIGGATNSPRAKRFALALLALVALGWYGVIHFAPSFTLTLTLN